MQPGRVDHYRIVCGVDFTRGCEHALLAAGRLAARTKPSVLHVVHALGRQRSVQHEDLSERAVSRLEAYVHRILSRTSDILAEQNIVFHARVEDAPSALDAVARDERADVIIVGASTRSVLSRWWRRAEVASLMRRAAVPVLVVHEPGESEALVPALSERDESGVYSSVTLRRVESESGGGWLDADSASSMCRLYEARTSQPDLIAKAGPATTSSDAAAARARVP